MGPGLGHLDIFLLENHLAVIIGDFGGAFFPLDLVKGFDLGIAKNPFHYQFLCHSRFARFTGLRHLRSPRPIPYGNRGQHLLS